jgi:GTP-binding protein
LKKTTTSFAGSAVSPAQFPKDGLPEVAFLGRSNVGKSSLLNALVKARGLARVSSTPGRTRLVNFFRVGDELYLADLPGYGYARVSQGEREGWEALVTSYLLDRKPLALCVFLVDLRHEPGEGDQALRHFLDHHGLAYVVAGTKADKLGRGAALERMKELRQGVGSGARGVVAVSAQTGSGVAELWQQVRQAALAHRQGAA